MGAFCTNFSIRAPKKMYFVFPGNLRLPFISPVFLVGVPYCVPVYVIF